MRYLIPTLIPPSAMTTELRMKLARSDERKAMISAISSGCAARPTGADLPCSAASPAGGWFQPRT